MNSTWLMQMRRKNCAKEASAASLSVPPVTVATAGAVTGGEVFLVGNLLPRKPARRRP